MTTRTRMPPIPSLSDIRTQTYNMFGIWPCLWQIKVTETLLKGGKDVICITGTGMGKTLTFWMPLLFRSGGIQIVVTPLNLLGKQNIASLARVGIRAIAISSETATPANFQAIRAFHYQVIVVSPKQIMKPDWDFEQLLKTPLFVSQIISIVIDEAHCLTDWGEFRPDTYNDIMRLLHMQKDKTIVCHRSSDRPNIKIGVRKIKYALNSFTDLMFLILARLKVGDPPPPKFLVIKWFNADMSTTFKEEELENLLRGETWGFCTTTSFGMRFGRTAQDQGLVGTTLLLAEKEYFEDEKVAKAARKAQKRKRTAQEVNLPGAAHPSKHAAVSSIGQMTKNSPPSHPSQPVVSQSNEGVDGDTNRSSDKESDGDEGEMVHANAPDQISTEPAGSLEALLQAWRKRDLDPMINYLINTERYDYIGCRHRVFDVYSDHLECDPHSAEGCTCCHIMQPTVCCDIHDPSVFSSFEADIPHTSRAAQQFHPPKYTQMEQDRALGDALHNWREDKTSALFGWAALNNFGPCLVMPNSILDQIINCAHYNKIETLQDLKKETGWTEADKLGGEVIALIQRHAPPRLSPLVSTPLSRQPTPIASTPIVGLGQFSTTSSDSGHVRHCNKCSACGQEGHNDTICREFNERCLSNLANVFFMLGGVWFVV
ncbi:hypothetical protein SCLCIDRAFT_12461 [Scleroderma citrinum Foug A]|uniref:DNA 3'-5' helicase n=1 Tax=Scleroderma citrinum Foug A TaxID=1036808 RepID=A0A0C3ERR9_9AGAM|nr:hypothetical protein SCLCIDRAFT_12461 [Scleroderma citrinum Foug A]